jgi:hyperosmotically inducible protein
VKTRRAHVKNLPSVRQARVSCRTGTWFASFLVFPSNSEGEFMLTMRKALPLAMAAVALAMTGCQATRTEKTAGEYVDDTVVTSKVKTALIGNPTTKAMQIDVETFRGAVQLNGFVDSMGAKNEATRVAQSVEGVREVHNNLEVDTGSTSAGEAISDATLTARVKTALIADQETKAHQINVETEDAIVQLAGWVDNAEAKAAATRVARSVEGVRDVRNELEVKSMR